MKSMKVKQVGLYARVSTNNGQDPEVQLRELREYCQRRGFTIVEEFVDRGISGSRGRRPALDKLLVACRRRLVDGKPTETNAKITEVGRRGPLARVSLLAETHTRGLELKENNVRSKHDG